MLQIKQVYKEYRTGSLVQKALDGVSLSLRESEFVAILGPSGSGKTTLLNIIGGLDRYDKGDLIINGISTKKYTDRDWDSYRNHTVGLVFQSYNLIPHQTVLANVELALTISGVSRRERRCRAQEALDKVGLGDQSHKKPNQMSGGQMQRVALARALVNDPDVLLADEPTGALDSETSVQVMELLKEVAKDRLVVMVTHNPELAQAYATRIVKLKDGKILSDSDPYTPEELSSAVHKNKGRSSMSFWTALSLSFNNLRTKKARTLLTAFAGSIGIIGIALILSMSNGVNAYIKNMEEDTLSEYPLQIMSTGLDMTSRMLGAAGGEDSQQGEVTVYPMVSSMISQVDSNDLKSLKAYLDGGTSGIEQYVTAVEYSYDVTPQIFRLDGDGVRQVNPDKTFSALGFGSTASSSSLMSRFMSTDVFHEMPAETALYENQYDVKAGHWPENDHECVLVLSTNGMVSDLLLYTLGFRDAAELDEMVKHFIAEEATELPESRQVYAYSDFLGVQFKLVNGSDYYQYDSRYGVWTDKSDDSAYLRRLAESGEDLTIVGVVQPKDSTTAAMLQMGIGYPAALTRHVIDQAAASEIVKQQLAKPGINVLSGKAFGQEDAKSDFSLSSLFSVNEGALKNAFQFDESALQLDYSPLLNLDLSDLDLSRLDLDSLELPEFTAEDLVKILSKVDVSVSPEGAVNLVKALLEGYKSYAAAHPEADYSGLGESFLRYLKTEQARQRIDQGLERIVQSSLEVKVAPEELEGLVKELMEGFQSYLEANGLTDPDRLSEYLNDYLQTPEAKAILTAGASKVVQVSGEITVSPEELEALAAELAEGYEDYVKANGLPDPAKMGEHFLAYLQTDEAQKILSDGISQVADLDALKDQLSQALKEYFGEHAGAYSKLLSDLMGQITGQLAGKLQSAMNRMFRQLGESLPNAISIDETAFAGAIEMKMDEKELSELLRSLLSTEETTLENNLKKFGYADLDSPSTVSLYPRDFDSKSSVLALLDRYNEEMRTSGQEEKAVTYTDMVGTLMSSVTKIVNIVSYVLVAFVAISLVVSSIMIGVITYISVLERRKEIGILRAIGASKHNVSQVFNAETFIIGLCAGVIGIGLTLVLIVPGNMLLHSLTGQYNINASLPALHGVVLIALSVVLTMLGGLIPSKKAAKSDPVAALRSE